MFPFVVDVEMSPPTPLSLSLHSNSTSSFYCTHNSEACNRNLKEENKIETKHTHTHTHTQNPNGLSSQMIFKEDTKKTKTGNKTIQSPKEMCRDYENLTCGKKGRPTHLLSLWESWAGELEARKTASKNAAEKHCNKANRRQREPTIARPGTGLSLSFSLWSEGNLRRGDPVSILGPGDWSPVATTSELRSDVH